MTDYKIQIIADLKAGIRAEAKRKPWTPRGKAKSADVLLSLLTPENRILLEIIWDDHP